jgi:hypothetical protein
MPTLNYPIRIKRERNLIDLPEQNPGGALVVLMVFGPTTASECSGVRCITSCGCCNLLATIQ